jgi:phosphoglycerate dehydrogenase-like enzyme
VSNRQTSASNHPERAGAVAVLLTTPLPPPAVAELREVDPRLQIFELSQAETAIFARPSSLDNAPAGSTEASLLGMLARAEVLVTFPQSPLDLGTHVPQVRWIQLLTAGADELPDRSLVERVPVTTLREVRARPVAEYAMLLVLTFAKRLRESIDLQRRHSWRRLDLVELHGKTLGVVGLGSIGREVSRLGRAFGMTVVATRRRAVAADGEIADEVLPADRILDLLRRSDFVVLTAPSTRETFHLIGREELRAMRRSAVLINVARGALVDEDALLEALQTKQLAGAGLDVFEQEPLPASSPFYRLPNVLVTSHNAGMTDRFLEGALPILVENLRRFLAGEPLHNQVDPMRGY